MVRERLVLCSLVLAAGAAQANTYTVTILANSGTGSLRRAINQANTHAGADTIKFAAGLSGQTISPTTALPVMTDDGTTINGDINADGAPDICLDGGKMGHGAGLAVQGDACVIAGLAITNFGDQGILLDHTRNCVIRTCHVGVDLAGAGLARNGGDQIRLDGADQNTVGAPNLKGRNVIASGEALAGKSGVLVYQSGGNRIRNCNLGIARDGKTALTAAGQSGYGIVLYSSPRLGGAGNVIGGSTAVERNVFGGLTRGIHLRLSRGNIIQGNYVGLARNGNTVVPIGSVGMWIHHASSSNLIGGLESGQRNVFAGGAHYGIHFEDEGTVANTVFGNYFGLNAAGTAQRLLIAGVRCGTQAGGQTIGRSDAPNYFCPKSNIPALPGFGVSLEEGPGSTVDSNRFGLQPDGQEAPNPCYKGVSVYKTYGLVTRNHFRNAGVGVQCWGSTSGTWVMRNVFKGCEKAVELTHSGVALLGNRGNAATDDDGLNQFWNSNTWYIYNDTPNDVKAEGNRFQTTSVPTIHLKIWDHQEYSTLGAVDVEPLGTVLFTRFPRRLSLGISSAEAAPTAAGGAEIVFALTAPAQVTVDVLNLAGRAVATPAATQNCPAGSQRVLWSGQTASGTLAPAGRYLVRVTARGDQGEAVSALLQLSLRR